MKVKSIIITSPSFYEDRCACALPPEPHSRKANTHLAPLWAPFPLSQPQLFAGIAKVHCRIDFFTCNFVKHR